ncbi:MAG TPA: lycopene cyclase domain-containing protein [Jatrophihabitantaceae bacterium]|nr:lycopene cyclase domain-containing protein [Jatrophihabitantaceae bacterium]
MSYTLAAVLGVLGACLVDLVLLRTMLLRRRAFWTSYAIIAFFQLIVNGLLTGLDVVRYDPRRIIGARIVYAPVEDLLFGFALVLVTLSLWVWWGRIAARRYGQDAARARSRAAR